MNRVLRERELAWELHRDWAAALAKHADKGDEAKTKTLEKASNWVEHSVDAAELIALVARALPDRAKQLSSMN